MRTVVPRLILAVLLSLFAVAGAVAFVLVDFKGGAAFADLAQLPQVAGLITNLQSDLSMVDRALAALQGELARRLGVSRQTINSIEKERDTPFPCERQRIDRSTGAAGGCRASRCPWA